METSLRCQSCGMPLGPGFYGTEKSAVETTEYCIFCYSEGVFVNPELTVEEMIDTSVEHMKSEFHFSEEKARALAREIIPI